MQNSRAIFLLLLANSVSGVAQGIAMLAVPWYFTGVIQSEGLFGKVYLWVTAISLFWGLYAGTIIDRYDRKKIFLGINLAGLTVISTITAIGFYQQSLHWFFVAAVFGSTAFIYNIHFPNLYAFAQEITDKKQYAKVTSLLEIQGQLTFTIAGGIAAILLNGIDGQFEFKGHQIQLPFVVQPWKIYEIFSLGTVAYLITFLLIYRIQSMPVVDRKIDTGSLLERMNVGFDFLKKHPPIFHFGNASLLLFLTILIFGTYVATMYVKSFLGAAGDVYAIGDMTFSIGALIAGFVSTRIFGERKVVQGIIILSALAGVMYLVMIGSKSIYVFFLANFIIGACNAAVRIQRVTYMFHHIPNKVIGRTGSIFFVINVVLRFGLIGLFTIPFFHEAENIVYAVAILAGICFAAAVILAANYKRLTQVKTVV
jgi:DHA3 family macrolide efflux protein-like MFS transporter